MIFFPAMLKTFEECQMKYYYSYIEKISMPQDKYIFEKGKNIHAIASYYIKGYDVSKLEKILTKEESAIWNYLKSSKYFKFSFLYSEYQLTSRLGDDWISGRLDALVKNENDYYILDYKTGSTVKDAQNDYQTMVYLLCTDSFIKDYDSLFFVYLNLKDNSEKVVKFTKDLEIMYKEKLQETINLIKNTKTYKPIMLNNIKCKCNYYNLCENL
ncbi:MAG: PD-(D/E)XK nuclease family protein [Candidatus Gastranaerophilaceae bacterium]